MRDRQLIAQWAYEHGKDDNVIEKIVENGKTYFVINDYDQLRKLFGELLREVQRIKSQGDYEAGKKLVEQYGVKADQDLIPEMKARYEQLNVAPYSGFIQPELLPVMKGGEIIDIRVEYPDDFAGQMMKYGKAYAFLK
jgi:dipeptidyl-peptidase-3